METLKRYVSGQHTSLEIRLHLAALALVYWGLVFCAWRAYPAEHHYSVTTHTLSALGSFDARHNPESFWVFSLAMVYCGLTMMPVILYIRRRVSAVSDFGAQIGALFFLAGCAAIVLTGLFPDAHARVLGDWQSKEIHRTVASSIGLAFGLGIIWHGVLLLKDKLTRETFAGVSDYPYLKLVGPFLLCVPIFVTAGFRIRWASLYAALLAAAGHSRHAMAANWSAALRGFHSFPLLEHLAIWALTIFVIWFAAALPREAD